MGFEKKREKKKVTVIKLKKESNTSSKTAVETYTSLCVEQNSSGEILSINTLEIDVPNGSQQNLNELTFNLVSGETSGYSGAVVKRNVYDRL